jgi:hypothetical protein
MESKFETKEELVEWIETMHLQNTNGRETEEEMFRLGIEAAIQELTEFNLFSIHGVVKSSYCEDGHHEVMKDNGYCGICNKKMRNIKRLLKIIHTELELLALALREIK